MYIFCYHQVLKSYWFKSAFLMRGYYQMGGCDYLAWLNYDSSRRILFLEQATIVGSEVFQAPICAKQAIDNLHAV